MRDLYWTEWLYNRLFFLCFGFPLSVSFLQCAILLIAFTHDRRHRALEIESIVKIATFLAFLTTGTAYHLLVLSIPQAIF